MGFLNDLNWMPLLVKGTKNTKKRQLTARQIGFMLLVEGYANGKYIIYVVI